MKIPHYLEIGAVRAEIDALLIEFPELRDDREALVMSLQSETNAVELCERMARAAREDEAHGQALRHYIAELRIQRDRKEARADRMRKVIMSILDMAGIRSLPTPTATLVISRHQHVIVTDREAIPEQYRKQPPWEPMLQIAKADMKAGRHVPGMTLSNPEPSLMIRTK